MKILPQRVLCVNFEGLALFNDLINLLDKCKILHMYHLVASFQQQSQQTQLRLGVSCW